MDVSIVIPTRNRAEDLRELLCSILDQTIVPIEVIIVDDSDNFKTMSLVEQIRSGFYNKKIILVYKQGGEEEKRSISHARNIGVLEATGDFIFFVDDDIILANDYIEKVLEIYKKYPNALGVQGKYTSSKISSLLSTAIQKVLVQPYSRINSSKVFPGAMTFPNPLTKVINCQWLSGGLSSFRREVFIDFKWDENLKRYSLCEDMDISYRIQKHYPNSLFATPYARAHHKHSSAGRIKSRYLVYTEVAYPTYFFFKNMNQTLLNKLIFFWSMFFGRFISVLIERPASLGSLINAYFNLLMHFGDIINGSFLSLEAANTKK